jgi:hypothetical protein
VFVLDTRFWVVLALVIASAAILAALASAALGGPWHRPWELHRHYRAYRIHGGRHAAAAHHRAQRTSRGQ